MSNRLWYNNISLDGNDGGALFCATDHNLMVCRRSALHKTFFSVLPHLGNGGKSYGGRFAMLTNEDWAYWAAFFEGDGCVSITGYRDRPPCLVVVFSQATFEILEQGRDETGLGNVYTRKKHAGRYTTNPLYDWRLNMTDAETFLKHIFPYTRMKRKQVGLALRFMEVRHASGIKKWVKTPSSVCDALWEYADRLSAFKTKTRKKGTSQGISNEKEECNGQAKLL